MNHHAASSTERPTRQEAVVLKDGGLVLADGIGDALPLLDVEHDAGVVVEEPVIAVERARILGERVEQPSEGGPGASVGRVRVGGGHHVGASGVHL